MDNGIEISKDEQEIYRAKRNLISLIFDFIFHFALIICVYAYVYICFLSSLHIEAVIIVLLSFIIYRFYRVIMSFADELVVSNRCLRWRLYGNYDIIDWDDVKEFSFEHQGGKHPTKILIIKPVGLREGVLRHKVVSNMGL